MGAAEGNVSSIDTVHYIGDGQMQCAAMVLSADVELSLLLHDSGSGSGRTRSKREHLRTAAEQAWSENGAHRHTYDTHTWNYNRNAHQRKCKT